MVFAFAPIVGVLLGISAITVPWETLMTSVGIATVVGVLIEVPVMLSVVKIANASKGWTRAAQRCTDEKEIIRMRPFVHNVAVSPCTDE